jgi:4-hydroxy-3-polyprenylbenzoate decarboxylase
VRAPAAGLSNIAYAKIKQQGAGDGKQALAVMLGASKMALPKVAYVFDEDVDIWDDNEIGWCMAFRFDPIRDTVIIPGMNTMTVDPKIPSTDPPGTTSKIGFDCTIRGEPNYVRSDFQRSAPFVLGDPPEGVTPLTDAEIATRMESFIAAQPRSWKDILEEFNGQTYSDVYRAFGTLRSRLGRVIEPPFYPYAFSDGGDFIGDHPQAAPTAVDPKHHVT